MTVLSAHDFPKVLVLSGIEERTLARKVHVQYLSGYLKQLNAATAVVERDYVDRDFLEDHTRYYCRSFKKYDKKCVRIHFFAKEIDKAAIERSLLGVDCVLRQELESSYLGFIVIRPLQKTFVGRTCLVPLRDDSSRHFKALCRIQVSFFGLAMTVACMPFQEQDTAVAACATCALWSAFFVTSSIFRHPVLTPGQITELATGHGLSLARRFPNSGLSIMDVAFAIRRAELSPLCICVKQAGHVERMFRKSIILTNIRAYLELGVPLLLFGDVLDDSGRVNGAHALVVNGYHMGGISQKKRFGGVAAETIDKLYLHDDQLGPYARAKIDRSVLGADLEVSWADSSESVGGYKFRINYLVVPLYHKIRVDYECVWRNAIEMQQLLTGVNELLGIDDVSWDFVLATNNEFKQQVKQDNLIDDSTKLDLLEASLPRFLWIVTLNIDNKLAIKFGVDATDASQGIVVVCTLVYSDIIPVLYSRIVSILNDDKFNPLVDAVLQSRYDPNVDIDMKDKGDILASATS